MSDGAGDRLTRLRAMAASAPEDARAAYFLAHEYFREGRWDEAEAAYRRYLALEPDDEGVGWRNLATSLARLGRLDEAEDSYRRAVEAALAHDHEELAAEIRELIEDL